MSYFVEFDSTFWEPLTGPNWNNEWLKSNALSDPPHKRFTRHLQPHFWLMNRCQNWPWPVGDLLSIVWTLDQKSRQCRGQKCCFSWPPKVRFQGCIALTSVRRIRPDEAEFYSPYMALLPRIRLLEKIKGIFEEYHTRIFNLLSNYDLGQSPSKLRYPFPFGLHYAFAFFSMIDFSYFSGR